MKKIKVFETFAGIGAQNKALQILKNNNILDYEVVGTSEWDIWANIAYNAIHYDNKNVAQDVPNQELEDFLNNFSHSYNSKTPCSSGYINNLNRKTKELLYSAYKNSNNLGSILTITGSEIHKKIGKFDLLTYSFPCQDLSVAGSFHGFNQGMAKGSGTRSGLLWEIERILKELKKLNSLPKYLLLENVKNMISKRHEEDYVSWLRELKNLGYATQTYLLRADEYGIPQVRERVYALSVLDNNQFDDTLTKENRVISKNKIKSVSKQLKIDKKMSEILKYNYSNRKYMEEALLATPNRTPSRGRMFDNNPILYTKNKSRVKEKHTKIGDAYFMEYARTITTKQDRHPNAGNIDLKNTIIGDINGKAKYRFLTNREAYEIMGFDSKDFDKINKYGIIKKEVMYRQAGNSIVVNVLVSIFNYMIDY